MLAIERGAAVPVQLSALSRTQGNNRRLKDGTVVPEGFPLEFQEMPVLVQGFRRMVRELAYDVSEMALTTYLTAKEHGVKFTALPIFLVRGFHHNAIVVRRDSGLTHPGQLAGKRVGVNRGYTVTTGVWARAIMANQYGLDLDSVTWVLSGDEHVQNYVPPSNVISAPSGRTLEQMVLDGELDAAIGVKPGSPDLVTLIPDADQAAIAALQTTGLYPINHLVVIRDEILEAHPDAAVAVFEAFAESKRQYLADLKAGALAEPDSADRLHLQVLDATGWDDPLPYGVDPNREVLEDLMEQASRQHILTRKVKLDQLFAEPVRGLTG
ncbi:4,5-dihydroxyphthalate decarboxylase [Paenarthrobacter ureafaciens]|nr:4,5-dihydroxyphthalate decarboxylase [Arthrobacter sp. M5]NKR16648.1 4,5-dihydroxyphthalate decarboxylase [Arthrobacter sp. M6]NWL25620.1 4,5-dihydroxyphthalate decarboxylase [Paenarthrobacter ureafaciens]OEH57857.1 4,5-dihydroxyphthalate decarboxylase [Arthrobacter sp. D2]OEH65087.1 4,5-dihydroxyphthalate decarboxylase [Arthrobacter sp. D4]